MRDHDQTIRVVTGAALVGLGVSAVSAVYELLATPTSKGRLLRLRGGARLPEVASGAAWRDEATVQLEGLSADERGILTASWLAVACMGHGAVAAYGQLAVHLAALGAPADLVEQTHRAALTEIAHARRCFGLASAFAGKPLGAGPISELARAEKHPVTFARLAIGTLVQGCLTGAVVAATASTGARTASDPAVQSVLNLLTAGETQHLELAWSIFEWAVKTGGAPVREPVRARIEKLGEELAPRAADLPGIDRARLAQHGFLDQDMLGAIATRCIDKTQSRARTVRG